MDMTQGTILPKLVRFSFPFMLANLFNTVYNLADMAVIGQFCSSSALSAASITGTATTMLYIMGIAFGTGGQILVSQYAGAGKKEVFQSLISSMVLLCGGIAIAVAVAGAVLSRSIVNILNTPAEAVEEAVTYLRICCFGVIPAYIYNTFAHALRGMGDSRTPFIIVLITSVMNIILDVIFIAVFHMGVAGAAVATAVSQLCSCIFCVVYLYPRRESFGFNFRIEDLRMDTALSGEIIRLSIPLAISNIAISFSMLYVSSYINVYGVAASIVNGVGAKLHGVMSIVTFAMQAAVATFVGQNIGAQKPDRAASSVYWALLIEIAFWALISVVILLFPRTVFRLFSDDPDVLDLAAPYFRIAIWMYLASCLMSPFLGMITGVGRTRYNLLVSLLDGVAARVGLSILFGTVMDLGLRGYWIGSSAAGYVSVIMGAAFFLFGNWKKSSLVSNNSMDNQQPVSENRRNG